MKSSNTLVLALLLAASFLCGQLLQRPQADAQGRGAVNPPPASTSPGQPGNTATPAPQIVYSEESGQSSAGGGFLAVTGSYGVGTSVLYLIDTQKRQLAVYEARGGSAEQRRIVFVGARKIDLDLQLEGYNDRSEYEYRRLQRLFEKRGATDGEVTTGLEPGAGRR